MEKINIIKAIPNFPFLESTIDGLSYYQLLAGLNDYVNKLVDEVNSIGGGDTQIKEMRESIKKINDLLGNDTLKTTAVTITSAINELFDTIKSIETSIGNDNLSTSANTLIGAINELVNEITDNQTNIGNLTDLTTTSKESLVKAINEVNAKPSGSVIGNVTMTLKDINITPNSYYTVENLNTYIPENKSFLFACLESYSYTSSGDIELYNMSAKLYLRSVNGCTFSKLHIKLFYQ